MTSDGIPAEFDRLLEQATALSEGMDRHFPSLAAARRKYFATRSEEDRAELDRIQALVEDLRDRHGALRMRLRSASGLTPISC